MLFFFLMEKLLQKKNDEEGIDAIPTMCSIDDDVLRFITFNSSRLQGHIFMSALLLLSELTGAEAASLQR